MSERQ